MMDQNDRDLLLRDLSARLPYGVIVETYWEFENKKVKTFPKSKLTPDMLRYYIGEEKWKYNTHFLPFLRPMSSMTELERKKLDEYIRIYSYNIFHKLSVFCKSQDYLNSIHVDYRGLIEKGLALEAHEGMYNINEK